MRIKIIVCIILFALYFLYQTNWLSSPLTWDVTTGWIQLDEKLRPAAVDDTLEASTEPKIRWLGHAGIFLNWHGKKILFDPNVSKRCTFISRAMLPPIAASELPAIDLVAISHAHFDHLDNGTLKEIKHIGVLVTPRGTDTYVDSEVLARTKSVGLEIGTSFRFDQFTITAVKAEHRGGRFHPFESQHIAVGYILTDGLRSLYFAGDTAVGPHIQNIREAYHPEIALLPIGGFEPRFPLKFHHLSPEEAVDVAVLLGSKLTIPIHFGTFRLAFDPLDSALPRFAIAASEQGVQWQMPAMINSQDLIVQK